MKYLREFTAREIQTRWERLKASLQKQSIIAFAVAEITTRRHILLDGSHWDYPINQIHYHCLVESDLSERQLRKIFNCACLDAGLMKGEFEVHYESIPDRKNFKHKCEYILKHGKFKDQAILFQPGTGINKICSIGRWFVNANGSRASKDKMWESIVASWYPK
jgi:hypothetical protein